MASNRRTSGARGLRPLDNVCLKDFQNFAADSSATLSSLSSVRRVSNHNIKREEWDAYAGTEELGPYAKDMEVCSLELSLGVFVIPRHRQVNPQLYVSRWQGGKWGHHP